jgi:PQQ-dependent catabolism-associated CXXCW motif protein
MRRNSIPGSFWLPNVGYGRLHPAIEAYFKTQLERLTGGERGKAVLIYCLERCWMSWNAAKRALEYGYTNMIWYPDGTDGWAAAGHPLERKQPEK